MREVDEALTEAFVRLTPQLSPGMRVASAADLSRIIAQSNAALFAAVADRKLLGVLTLVWYDVPSGRKAWIEDVVVDAAARGMGAGEALMQAALTQARHVGACRVQLTSSPQRAAAHGLYRKMGFERYDTSVFVLKIENIK